MDILRGLVSPDSFLEIYQLAQVKNVTEFTVSAANWLQKYVDFDMALFGLISKKPDGSIVTHHGQLINEPAPVLDEWVSLVDKDKIVSHMVNNVGKAFSFCVPMLFKSHLQILDFAVRSRHMNVLAAASDYGPNQLMTGLSLRRADRNWVFSQADLAVFEMFLPHINEAFRINRALFAKAALPGVKEPKRGLCICDEAGYAIYQDDVFIELSAFDIEDGSQHRISSRLRASLLISGGSGFTSEGMTYSAKKIGKLWVLMVRPVNLFDGLSSRELSVATLYGQGLSHKQIAGEILISPATARRHVESIYSKLKIHTKSDLTATLYASKGDFVLSEIANNLLVSK